MKTSFAIDFVSCVAVLLAIAASTSAAFACPSDGVSFRRLFTSSCRISVVASQVTDGDSQYPTGSSAPASRARTSATDVVST